MEKPTLLRLENTTKIFPGVKALQNVSFELNHGEVVGLLGENGAGKSTLMNIIAGVYEPTSGEIYIEGNRVHLHTPLAAQKLGVGLVPQEPAFAANMTAADNIFLGREIRKGIVINSREILERSRQILIEIGTRINPATMICNMNMAEKEAVGIAKAMLLKPKILILDEVTSPLDQVGVENLFKVIQNLRQSGIGIIFISHRLREVFEITDKMVILRDGRNVAVLKTEEADKDDVIRLMVGNGKTRSTLKVAGAPCEPDCLLSCRSLCSGKDFSGVSFDLCRGEILGLAGLKGAGMSEVARALFGLLPIESGEIIIKGRKMEINQPLDAMRAGIGYIPPDRQNEGLAVIRNVEENINIAMLRQYSNVIGFLRFGKLKRNSAYQISALNIKTPSIGQKVLNLSGGNQQKVMIAKWLSRAGDIFIFDEPTRGVDVGAKAEIHRLLIQLRNEGKGIIVLSSELPELLLLSDRIILMEKGVTTQAFTREEASEEVILSSLHAGSAPATCVV